MKEKSKEIKIGLDDLKDYDKSIYNSLKFIRDDKAINFEEE